jgi:cobyrinic acid a,c-diamide synthase
MTPTIVIAGVHSGVGKTTVATGIMAAFARRGLRVQGFKVGPDYIDPSYHTAVTGHPSRTLDAWLVGRDATVALFQRAAQHADLCVIEGVMGLFDGRTGERGPGSTAEIATLLGAPVVLVVDAHAIARSAAAVVHGFRSFDPAVRVEGVVLNRLAGPGHLRAVGPPIENEAGVAVLGAVQRRAALAVPERYLGLIPVTEGAVADAYFDAAADAAAHEIDLERLLGLAATADPPSAPAPALFPAEPQPRRARIAVARDRAFSFYYADSLEMLEAWGAELLPFSPLADSGLPAGTQGIFIGGGFPELFAAELAENAPMLAAIRAAHARGMPLYGECGGYMYLGHSLTDAAGRPHRLAGVLPLESTMSNERLTLGYREVRTLHEGPHAPTGRALRGHEFHWSIARPLPPEQAAYAVRIDGSDAEYPEGSVNGSAWGSYVHLHFGADPALAQRFVSICAMVTPAGTTVRD